MGSAHTTCLQGRECHLIFLHLEIVPEEEIYTTKKRKRKRKEIYTLKIVILIFQKILHRSHSKGGWLLVLPLSSWC
jgi:hypothetical protein